MSYNNLLSTVAFSRELGKPKLRRILNKEIEIEYCFEPISLNH